MELGRACGPAGFLDGEVHLEFLLQLNVAAGDQSCDVGLALGGVAMKPIISLIHAGGSVSIIPAASPNIPIMYFIVITSLDVAPRVGTHD